MEEIISRCGFRCDLCMAYQPNLVENPENAEILSDGWFKYFGFRVKLADIHCKGCLNLAFEPLDNECPVRPCALERQYATCAECDEFLCDKLKTRIVDRLQMEKKLRFSIPEEDYRKFVLPYENKLRLMKLRNAM